MVPPPLIIAKYSSLANVECDVTSSMPGISARDVTRPLLGSIEIKCSTSATLSHAKPYRMLLLHSISSPPMFTKSGWFEMSNCTMLKANPVSPVSHSVVFPTVILSPLPESLSSPPEFSPGLVSSSSSSELSLVSF